MGNGDPQAGTLPTAKETAMGPNYRPGGRILFALRLRCMPRRASSHASGTNLHYSALAKTRGSRTPRSAHGPRYRVRASMIPRLSSRRLPQRFPLGSRGLKPLQLLALIPAHALCGLEQQLVGLRT